MKKVIFYDFGVLFLLAALFGVIVHETVGERYFYKDADAAKQVTSYPAVGPPVGAPGHPKTAATK